MYSGFVVFYSFLGIKERKIKLEKDRKVYEIFLSCKNLREFDSKLTPFTMATEKIGLRANVLGFIWAINMFTKMNNLWEVFSRYGISIFLLQFLFVFFRSKKAKWVKSQNHIVRQSRKTIYFDKFAKSFFAKK